MKTYMQGTLCVQCLSSLSCTSVGLKACNGLVRRIEQDQLARMHIHRKFWTCRREKGDVGFFKKKERETKACVVGNDHGPRH